MTDDTIPEGYMRNGSGDLVRRENIKPQHLLEDELAKKIAAKAAELNKMLAEFRQASLDEVAGFREMVAAEYGAKYGGDKGNVTITSFDGSLRVVVAVNDRITFGPELSAAKSLIDEYVIDISERAGGDVAALVQHAFQVKKGKVDTGRVLGLRRLDGITDERWLRAMDAIADAVKIVGSKTYMRVYRRDPETEIETPISLDLANA